MKKQPTYLFCKYFSLVLVFVFIWGRSSGQLDKKDRRLVEDSRDAIADFIHTDALMKNLFSGAYGYVVFPSVGKGAVGVGGASGGGTVFEKDSVVGKAQMTQVTIGFQFGGQAYREVVFFQDKKTLDRFKQNKVEFSAQVSAVAAKAGASGNAKYTGGILIFTQQKGGLMYEASVGGQKFKYTPFNK
ncbi:MAG: YSC84-related protein [Bacteroidota bacterium]|nr:YSC84-related protein [Bacteroidota bacterium]